VSLIYIVKKDDSYYNPIEFSGFFFLPAPIKFNLTPFSSRHRKGAHPVLVVLTPNVRARSLSKK
jgi:hypothetical protein